MSSVTVIPYVAIPQGSFKRSSTKTHISFWGTWEWPDEIFDPHRGKPKAETRSAEHFINISEMRHLLYEQISCQANGDLASYAGFLMSCPIINAEATAELINLRRQLILSETKRWPDNYAAPIRIIQPQKFDDLKAVEVQLPSSLFWCDPDVSPEDSHLAQFMKRRFRDAIPMGGVSIDHLHFTIYIDDPKLPAKADQIVTFAWAIRLTFLKTTESFEKAIQRGKILGAQDMERKRQAMLLQARRITFDWRKLVRGKNPAWRRDESKSMDSLIYASWRAGPPWFVERLRPKGPVTGLAWSFYEAVAVSMVE